jgi:hypothetical protein
MLDRDIAKEVALAAFRSSQPIVTGNRSPDRKLADTRIAIAEAINVACVRYQLDEAAAMRVIDILPDVMDQMQSDLDGARASLESFWHDPI